MTKYRRHPTVTEIPVLPYRPVAVLDYVQLRVMGFGEREAGQEFGTAGRPRQDVYHALFLPSAGEAEAWTATARLTLVPGRAYWTPSHLPLEWTCRSAIRFYYALFVFERTTGVPLLDGWQTPVDLGPWEDPAAQARWRTGVFGTADIMVLQSLLLDRLARQPEVLEAITPSSDRYQSFAGRLATLEPRITATTTVAWLANQLDLSPRAVNTQFHTLLGVAPKAYLLGIIRQRARELLTSTALSSAAIAKHLGFANEAYFFAFFRRWQGMSPGEYRAAFRGR